tara:strand:+ start:722 stop:949 length:228 start_codon:yes stop_codon:yes gene_type:complete
MLKEEINKGAKKMTSKVIVKATNGIMEREETIDVENNVIFINCKNNKEIKKNYEAFWNIPNAVEKIKVLEVKEVF